MLLCFSSICQCFHTSVRARSSRRAKNGRGRHSVFTKQSVSYASPNTPPTTAHRLALLPRFVVVALVNFPEMRTFTIASGINNYQSALIHCSAYIWGFHARRRAMLSLFFMANNVWLGRQSTTWCMTRNLHRGFKCVGMPGSKTINMPVRDPICGWSVNTYTFMKKYFPPERLLLFFFFAFFFVRANVSEWPEKIHN